MTVRVGYKYFLTFGTLANGPLEQCKCIVKQFLARWDSCKPRHLIKLFHPAFRQVELNTNKSIFWHDVTFPLRKSVQSMHTFAGRAKGKLSYPTFLVRRGISSSVSGCSGPGWGLSMGSRIGHSSGSNISISSSRTTGRSGGR